MSKILREFVIVEPAADIATLQAVDTTSFQGDAISIYVLDEKATFVLDRASTQTADGVKVIAPTTGPGRWFRVASRLNVYAVTGNGGVADAYTATHDEKQVAYEDGTRVYFKVDVTNTGASTLNIDAVGSRKILYADNSELAAGDLVADRYYSLIYNADADTGTGAFVVEEAQDLRNQDYVVGTASAALPNAQSLGALTSGMLYNDVAGSTGTLRRAIPHEDYGLPASGQITGLEISINGGDPALFDISAGTAVIVDDTDPTAPVITPFNYAGSTGNTVTNIATQLVTYVLIDSAGTIIQQSTAPSPQQLRNRVYLGALEHNNLTNIGNAIVTYTVAYDEGQLARDLFYAFGPLNLTGHGISANGANLKFDRAAGTSLISGRNASVNTLSPNITNDAADIDVTFTYFYQDGAGGFTAVGSQTQIDPNQYDDGTGTLASVASNDWTIQRHFLKPNPAGSDLSIVYYGQQTFNTKAEALATVSEEDFNESSATNDNAVLVGYIVVKQGATNLSLSTQAEFINAGLFRAFGASGGSGGGGSVITSSNSFRLIQRVVKSSPGTLTKGTPVYPVGFDIGLDARTVEAADATSAATMPSIGILDDDITDSITGFAVNKGFVEDIDTSGFAVTDDLFVSTTSGVLTNTRPTGTALIQPVARVAVVNATTGKIYVTGQSAINELPNLPDTNIWIGDANGIHQEQTVGGDATLANDGTLTIANNAVTTAKINDDAVTLAKLAPGTAGNLITYDAAGDPAAVATGNAGQILTSNGAGAAPTFQDPSAAGEANVRSINQVAHGLGSAGDMVPVRYNGSIYVAATADSSANAEAVGVALIIGVDDFDLYSSGYVSGFTALAANTVYFVPVTAGVLTSTEPSTGNISKPMLVTVGTTDGYVINYRGIEAQTASSGGDMVLLNTQEVTTPVASVDFTSLISSSYRHYMIVIDDVIPVTDATQLYLRTSTDNGASFDSGASDYGWVCDSMPMITSPADNTQGDDADSQIILHASTLSLGTGTGEAYNGILHIYNPLGTNLTFIKYTASFRASNALEYHIDGSGVRLASADVDAFQFLMSSGNINSGTFKLYGLT